MPTRARLALGFLSAAATVLLSPPAFAQSPSGSGTGPLGGLLLLLLVSLVPVVFMTLTAFLKISTVLQIARGAIGLQNVPSSTVIFALSAALTLVTMAPVGSQMLLLALPALDRPAQQEPAQLLAQLRPCAEPLRAFLQANASAQEKQRFAELARQKQGQGAIVSERDWTVLIPSFMVSELTEAFALGFLIYLPFLIIDLVVANALVALGLQALSATQVSLPFKLLLFVAIDGWGLLARALIAGYGPG